VTAGGDGRPGPGGPAEDLALLRAHEPVVRFTAGELFLPTAAGPYVEQCGLWAGPGDGRGVTEQLVAPGGLTVERLAELGRRHRDRTLSLRFVAEPPDRAALRAWRREDRPRLRGGSRFAAVGLFTRTIDSILRVSLLLRGRVPGGLVAAAELAARAHLEPGRCTYHGRVVRDGGWTVLQYWFFYAFNDWRSTFAGINDHEADWELVCVYLAPDDDADGGPGASDGRAGRLVPRWVAASSHDDSGDALRRRWDDPRLTRVDGHPVVFAGAGSHAMAFVPDDYLVSVTLPALRRVLDVVTRIWRTVAPWSRATPDAGAFALPFLDYKRGDGPAVGPGGPKSWEVVPVDDAVPWVRDYRGLWGLDTHDVFGGERAPAGPRYDRGGTVRRSWADPLGWAGLQKVPSREADHRRVLQEHVARLADELTRLDATIAARRAGLHALAAQVRALDGRADLRATRAARGTELAAEERALLGTAAERTRLADEIAAYREHLAHAAVEAPDAHLGSTATRAARKQVRRPRFLTVWAAVSTPLLLLTIVVLFTAPPLAFFSSLALFVALFLGVEAAARGRLLSFLVGLVLTVATVGALVVVGLGLLGNWRAVLAGLLTLAAVVLFFVNVRELRRG
jgi:hypothetical protein